MSGPASGAWRPEHGAGDRLFADLGPLHLESGAVLPQLRMAYETWGSLDAERSNAVLVLHALTGDSHVVGGTGPLVATYRVESSGSVLAPAGYLVVIASVALVPVLLSPETARSPLPR